MSEPIPGPYAWPVIGNMFDVRSEEGGSRALEHLAQIYGPVFQLTLGGRKTLVVSSADTLKQVVDEKNFIKVPPIALDDESRPQGLFTAHGSNPDWGQAHRILTPAFGPFSVGNMIGEMQDIASQMCLKWARMGSDAPILLTDDFTRLTLDTIALCAMDFRFNSFYTDGMHPFVEAMNGTLGYSGKRASRPWIYNTLMGRHEAAQYREDVKVLRETAQEIIGHRREHPTDRVDLLNTMIFGKDPKTGESMRDELIGANMLTFLIAGHETTSGMLSFLFAEFLRHPHAYLKAQEEVDHVVGGAKFEAKHLKELKYLEGAFREALRLHPTAPGLTKMVHPDRRHEVITFCDGKYSAHPDIPIRVSLGAAMSDPTYFGEDAHEFVPERMMDTNPNFAHYMAAWKPFGNGSRSCIGQHFAWQEAVMVAALILQNFDLSFVDPSYQLHVKQALTVKPKDLYVRARLRKGVMTSVLTNRLCSTNGAENPHAPQPVAETKSQTASGTMTDERCLSIFYGSNSGTCQSLAQTLAAAATRTHGVTVSIDRLDLAVDKFPADHPVVIITASYDGQPTDDAARFVAWLEGGKALSLNGARYTVFGCGHKDWHETFYRIPKFIDTTLEMHGAKRFFPLGTSDVSRGQVMDDFDTWQDAMFNNLYGKAVEQTNGASADLAEIHTDKRATQLSQGLMVAKVKHIELLTHPDEPGKFHLEVKLPEDATYECGDYLSVLPLNPDGLVKQVLAHWQLTWDATIVFHSNTFASLPAGTVLSVYDILKGYFEISHQASKKNLEALKPYTSDAKTTAEIDVLTRDDAAFNSSIVKPKLSLFNFLILHPDINLPLPIFLSHLIPLRVRQYSISSSPLASPTTCSITFTLHRHLSCLPDGSPYEGVASTYLSTLQPKDNIHVSLHRPTQSHTPNTSNPATTLQFRLPATTSTPLLLFCAGTGLAPFRGFIQHRAHLLTSNPNTKLAPALLFIGCRHPDRDRLYAAELDAWSRMGAVDVRYAFSRHPASSFGCKYVSDRIEHDAEDVVKLWREGARVYICGSRGVLDSIKGASERIVNALLENEIGKEDPEREKEKERRKSEFEKAISRRVVKDVFD